MHCKRPVSAGGVTHDAGAAAVLCDRLEVWGPLAAAGKVVENCRAPRAGGLRDGRVRRALCEDLKRIMVVVCWRAPRRPRRRDDEVEKA